MTNLEPRADKVVREAVDAFMEGRLVSELAGETAFETKNSRYRLLDGVIVAAPDASLIGAELVGWLCQSGRRYLVESAWQHGARAVLVDRRRGRNIIVTSTTRLLHAEEPGVLYPAEPKAPPPGGFRSWHPPPMAETPKPPPMAEAPRPPAMEPPPFSPQRAPIVASTPPPPLVAEPAPPPEPGPPPKRTIPPPVAIPPPSPFMTAAAALGLDAGRSGQKRGGVHMPPRPVGSRPRATQPAKPLPAPVPPPRRPSPIPAATSAKVIVPAPPALPVGLEPAEAPPWELTSAELEVVEPPSESVTEPRWDREADVAGACQDDAAPFELARPRAIDNEPVNSEPFPLVRARDGSVPPQQG